MAKDATFNLLTHIRDNDEYSVIWLFNIGLEKFWNGEVYTVKNSADDIIVNHMEEMNLLITRKQDILILRDEPDEAYLNALRGFGAEIPTIVCTDIKDETKSISEIVLQDKALQDRIKGMVGDNDKTVFVPYGVSYLEEQIADVLGVRLFGSSSDINKRVNNKVFSRSVAVSHSFRVPEGRVCKGFDELQAAAAELLDAYGKIIIKEPCGASGKGLWVVETTAKLKSALLIIKRFFKDRLEGEWLVERWCDKKADLNYQVYVGDDGDVEVFSVKEQKVEGTVYVGSVIPPSFSENIILECLKCGRIIGKELYEFGYRGILGIDAMLTATDELIPIVEINGRFTLSTYLSFIGDRTDGITDKIFAFYKRVSLVSDADYMSMADRLKDAGLWFDRDGVFIYTSETITERRVGEYGRLFALCMGEDEDRVKSLYKKVIDTVS